MTAPEVEVSDRPEHDRYEITMDGELAGFLTYRRDEAGYSFLHTEIVEQYGGQGLASRLVRSALDTARSQRVGVLPFCSSVRRFVQRHPDYLDLVPAADRERFGLAGS
jgi:predicted GNAT family acetyltransferase